MIPLDAWIDLFTQMDVSLVEKVVRTVAVYLAIAVLIRLAGKRLMAQMNSLDLVVVLLLSNVVQNAIIGPDNSLLGGLVGAVVLLGVNNVLDRLAHHYPSVRWLLEGRSTRLITKGKVDEEAVRRLGLTDHELKIGLRRLGADDATQVQHASLEPGGDLMVRIAPGAQAATHADLNEALADLKTYLDERLPANPPPP